MVGISDKCQTALVAAPAMAEIVYVTELGPRAANVKFAGWTRRLVYDQAKVMFSFGSIRYNGETDPLGLGLAKVAAPG